MRRSLLLVFICLPLAFCACASHQATRSDDGSVTKTQALVKSWAEVCGDHYRLTKSLPTASGISATVSDNGQLLSAYSESLDGRGGNLDRLDSWGTQLHCSVDNSGQIFVIASPGKNRVFDTNLGLAVSASQCYGDDVIYRVVLGDDGTVLTAELLKGVPVPKPLLTTPTSSPK